MLMTGAATEPGATIAALTSDVNLCRNLFLRVVG